MKTNSLKSKTMLVLKITVSIGLIAWVFISQVDLVELLKVFDRTEYGLLVLGLGIHVFGYIFSALRWQKLLQSQRVFIKLFPLYDSYLISAFFNLFMPTRVGGDIVRISDLRNASKSISSSASSVVIERFLGISVLFMFALCASLVRLPLANQIPAIWVGMAIGVFGILIFLVILYSSLVNLIISFIPFSKLKKSVSNVWVEFRSSAMLLINNPETLAWGLFYSLLLQLAVVIKCWIIGKAIGFNIPLLDYFFLIPIQLVLLMLPTINGIGLREGSSIVLFGFYGIAAADAVAFGLIDLAMMVGVGIIGCFRFISRRSIPQNYGALQSKVPESQTFE